MSLTRTEEQAEIALFLAQHPTRVCICGRYVLCLFSESGCAPRPEPFADIIDQLIERGRIVR